MTACHANCSPEVHRRPYTNVQVFQTAHRDGAEVGPGPASAGLRMFSKCNSLLFSVC